jgi:hypothetical protein
MTTIKQSMDQRLAASLGLSPPIDIAELGDAVVAWTATGYVTAGGDAASKLRLYFAEASELTDSTIPQPLLAMTQPAPPPILPELAVTAAPQLAQPPSEGETPLAWLTRTGDVTSIKDWVMSNGVSGPQAREWASFAAAMGWELIVTPPQDAAAAENQEQTEEQPHGTTS